MVIARRSADPPKKPATVLANGSPQPIHRVKAQFFRVLGHPVRVRILELLRDGERSVGALQAALEIDSSGTSQHLGALRREGLLESQRDGNSVYYRVKDPRTFQLLEVARQILSTHYEDAQAMLGELGRPDDTRPAVKRKAK
jgi:ArsR family transcriptional regulator